MIGFPDTFFFWKSSMVRIWNTEERTESLPIHQLSKLPFPTSYSELLLAAEGTHVGNCMFNKHPILGRKGEGLVVFRKRKYALWSKYFSPVSRRMIVSLINTHARHDTHQEISLAQPSLSMIKYLVDLLFST